MNGLGVVLARIAAGGWLADCSTIATTVKLVVSVEYVLAR